MAGLGSFRVERYQLAKIIGWAGTFRSRKRMQKLVYLLQAAGCPLEADYTHDHHGPYSHDVAGLTNLMVREHLLEESSEETEVGAQYSYCLTKEAKRQIDEFEQTPRSREPLRQLSVYEDKARRLIKADSKVLDTAAILVSFYRRVADWSVAADKTCQFKNLRDDGRRLLVEAEALARQTLS